MKTHWHKTLLAASLLLISSGLYSLAEVRTCILGNAIPKTSIQFFASSAFKGSAIKNKPIGTSKVLKDIYGASFSLKLTPTLETAIWLSAKDTNTAIELHAKYMFYAKDDTYVSVVPCLYNSAGKIESYNEVESCSLTGFGIPIILTKSTKRDLTMNMTAGFNSDWVTASDSYKPYTSMSTTQDYGTIWSPRANINVSVTAYDGNMYMTPEVGVSLAWPQDRGSLRFANFGITFGVKM